jgi:AcrR family transcriptional regulator
LSHREELLSAARRCLEERGYARTTARDLVAASGTNLASIGYHFGSKEALLTEALLGAFAEYTEKLLALAAPASGTADPLAQIRRSWVALVDGFAQIRPLMVAFMEAMVQAERNPELRAQLADGYEQLRATIARTVTVLYPGVPRDLARTVASLMIVVSDGLMVQWLLDAERAPSGADAFDVARLIFGS